MCRYWDFPLIYEYGHTQDIRLKRVGLYQSHKECLFIADYVSYVILMKDRAILFENLICKLKAKSLDQKSAFFCAMIWSAIRL